MWWWSNPNRRQVIFCWWTDLAILNSCDADFVSDIDAKEVVSNMRHAILRLKGEYMNETGSEVNYEGMRLSVAFADFELLTKHLKTVDISALSLDERKAFMINIYNSLTIHGLVQGVLGDPLSNTSRLKFYASTAYVINGVVLSLNDIEHGILRGNRLSPVPLSSVPFSSDDTSRLALTLDLDPRIHFALNCGARTCPPIGVYSADLLDSQLSRATRGYLNETTVNLEENRVSISMLFKWYRSDFGTSDGEILSWIETHAAEPIAVQIKSCREKHSTRPVIVYLPYDWNLPSSSST